MFSQPIHAPPPKPLPYRKTPYHTESPKRITNRIEGFLGFCLENLLFACRVDDGSDDDGKTENGVFWCIWHEMFYRMFYRSFLSGKTVKREVVEKE